MILNRKKAMDGENDKFEQAFDAYTKKEFLCGGCGTKMVYVGGLLDWECLKCGAEGSVEYDDVNKEQYVKIAKSYSYGEIYADPVGNQPDCCKSCGGPYPNCLTSCKIFDC